MSTPETPSGDQVEPRPGLDREEVMGVLRRRRRLFLSLFLGIWAAAIVLTLLQTPVYEAQTALLLQQSQPSSAMGMLGSALGSMALLGGSTPSLDAQQWMLLNPPLVEEAARQLGIHAPAGKLVKRVNVDTVGDSLAIVRARDVDPGRAADFANRIATLHVEKSEARAKQSAQKSVAFIAQELEQMRKQLFQSEESLRDYKLSRGIVDLPTEAQKSVSVIGDLAAQVAAARAEAASAARSADYYRRELAAASRKYVASSTIARNPLVQEIEARLSALEAQRAGSASVHGPEHPEMKQLDRQLAQTREELAQAVKTVISNQVEAQNPLYSNNEQALATAEAADRAARAREAALQGIVQAETRRLSTMPGTQTDLGRLERNATVASAVYVDLMKSYEQAKLKQVESLAGVAIFSPAQKPEKPIKPRKLVNAALGFLLGLLLAAMAAAVAEKLSDPLRSDRHARFILGLPSLGRVPAVRRGPVLLSQGADYPGSPLAEAFRALRTNLRFATPEGMPRVLLVTAAAAGDGKTTVASNLAVVLAQSGVSTLLVDGSLRRPGVHDACGLPNERGLSEVIVGAAPLDACVQATQVPGLSALPAGTTPPNPAELLDSDQASGVLAALGERFEAVVVDSPAWPLADPLLLARRSDGVLLVVRAGSTPSRAAEDAVEQLAAAGRRPVGLVTNGC